MSLSDLLRNDANLYSTYFETDSKFNIQILYTKIDRDKANRPVFSTYSYEENAEDYFYPASTIKIPLVLLSLEKLNNLHIEELDKSTAMITDSAYAGQTKKMVDESSPTRLPSIENYIKKILLVSDNDASNRLYEFLGTDHINKSLQIKGYLSTIIKQRIASPTSLDENRYSNPIYFLNKKNDTIYSQQLTKGKLIKPETPVLKGRGYIENDTLINRPMDFSNKNTMALRDQHDMLKAILFPEEVDKSRRFDLTNSDYSFLYRYLSQLPRETEYPVLPDNLPDAYCKYFLYGGTNERIPDNLRIFNKVGMAYGYMIDNAYIADFENNVEFMLSAMINLNENDVYNHEGAKYDALGFPFFVKLGKLIYNYELERDRSHTPDLKKFKSL